MKKNVLLLLALFPLFAWAQVGVGTETPHPSSMLEVFSMSKGFLPPRLTILQRDAIDPKPEGLVIYNLDDHCLQYWNATTWKGDCSGVPGTGTIATLDCAGAVNSGTLTSGVAASGATSIISYTGGNGGTHTGQTITSTGVTGLTATLSSGNFANGSGTVTYTITGTPATAGTANFAVNIGGQTCTLTRTVMQGAITGLNCGSAINTGTLTGGMAASGVTSAIPYTGGNGGTHSGQTVASTGVTGLTATLAPGSFANGNGSATYTITGTPSGAGTASFAINIGGQTCTLTRTVVVGVGTISGLNCGSATNNGTLTGGTAASGVTSSIPYTGGNGGAHNGQVVTSTGVTGLTARYVAGSFVNGNGSVTYTITGTPSGAGTASFAINIGGRTCTLSRTVVEGLPPAPNTSIDCTGWMVPNIGTSSGTVNGQSVTATVTASGGAANTTSNGRNCSASPLIGMSGFAFPNNTPAGSSSKITIKFNKSVSNIKLRTMFMTYFLHYVVTLKRNGIIVNPTATAIGSCTNISTASSGQTISIFGGATNTNSLISGVNIGGNWFDEVEITGIVDQPIQNGNTAAHLSVCVGNVL